MSQRVVIMLFDGFQLLDLAGPADVFSAAGLLDPSADYRVEVTAVEAGAVRSLSGVTVVVETPLRSVKGPIDTLLVVGGLPSRTAVADTRHWFRRYAGSPGSQIVSDPSARARCCWPRPACWRDGG